MMGWCVQERTPCALQRLFPPGPGLHGLYDTLYTLHTTHYTRHDDDDVYPRETPPHIRTARASPQRHTAAGTAAPTSTADTGNTVPQRANPIQTAYAHPRRRAQAQGQRLGTWTLVRAQKAPSADSTQWYHRKIGTSTITHYHHLPHPLTLTPTHVIV